MKKYKITIEIIEDYAPYMFFIEAEQALQARELAEEKLFESFGDLNEIRRRIYVEEI